MKPSVTREYPEILLDAYPELNDQITIFFEPKNPDIGDYKPVYTNDKGGVTVIADKKTDKLLYVLTKSNMYDIPEELR